MQQNRERLFGVTAGVVLDCEALAQPAEVVQRQRAAAKLFRTLAIFDRLAELAEGSVSHAAVVIKPCDLGTTAAGGLGVGLGAHRHRPLGIRLLLVEDRGDVGDGARRRDELLRHSWNSGDEKKCRDVESIYSHVRRPIVRNEAKRNKLSTLRLDNKRKTETQPVVEQSTHPVSVRRLP